VDIEGVNVEQGRDIFKLIEIIVERISVTTQKLSIAMLEKINKCKESNFPSKLELFKSKSDSTDCNVFLEVFDEYNVAKRLI
jgi:hypothetical protein